jgi:hypothetical protein
VASSSGRRVSASSASVKAGVIGGTVSRLRAFDYMVRIT